LLDVDGLRLHTNRDPSQVLSSMLKLYTAQVGNPGKTLTETKFVMKILLTN